MDIIKRLLQIGVVVEKAPEWEISEETKKAIAEIDENIAMATVRACELLVD